MAEVSFIYSLVRNREENYNVIRGQCYTHDMKEAERWLKYLKRTQVPGEMYERIDYLGTLDISDEDFGRYCNHYNELSILIPYNTHDDVQTWRPVDRNERMMNYYSQPPTYFAKGYGNEHIPDDGLVFQIVKDTYFDGVSASLIRSPFSLIRSPYNDPQNIFIEAETKKEATEKYFEGVY